MLSSLTAGLFGPKQPNYRSDILGSYNPGSFQRALQKDDREKALALAAKALQGTGATADELTQYAEKLMEWMR